MARVLERLVIVVAALAIAIGVIALLSGGLLAGRDAPGVAGDGAAPGTALRDQGDATLRPGALRPVYDSDPPTSGAHVPTALPGDRSPLSDDQLLTALAAGDVVFTYPPGPPPPGLVGLARSLAPPDTAALAATGQAVVLAPRAGVRGIVALAWARMWRAATASDPGLRSFAAYWLGRGAPRQAGALPSS